jgi:hypothetical protein
MEPRWVSFRRTVKGQYSESGESIGDSKRRFVLVRYLPELFLDNENHAMSDWGSNGRIFRACRPIVYAFRALSCRTAQAHSQHD